MSKFTIVIPVYRTMEYLDACVASVISQTFEDFEIILVDDGSPDNCGAMCDSWAEQDCRIRVVHQENGGLSAARNTGIRHAAGEYVMFLDSDDWWADNQVLAQIARHLARTGADILSFNYRKSYNGILEPPYFPETLESSGAAQTLEEMMSGGCWVTGACNKAIRRELLVQQDLFFRTGITAEDIDWTLRLALHGESFAFANVCVFIYRQVATSISHSLSPEKIECLSDNIRHCIRLLEQAAPEKAACMRPFVAYQYGALFYDVANFPAHRRSEKMLRALREMAWLLRCSNNQKVRLLRIFSRCFGFSVTFLLLQVRQRLLEKNGKGV